MPTTQPLLNKSIAYFQTYNLMLCIDVEAICNHLYNAFYAILSSKHNQVTRDHKKSPKRSSVKPVKIGQPKIDKRKVLTTNGSLMKAESIAECSLGAIIGLEANIWSSF